MKHWSGTGWTSQEQPLSPLKPAVSLDQGGNPRCVWDCDSSPGTGECGQGLKLGVGSPGGCSLPAAEPRWALRSSPGFPCLNVLMDLQEVKLTSPLPAGALRGKGIKQLHRVWGCCPSVPCSGAFVPGVNPCCAPQTLGAAAQGEMLLLHAPLCH